MKISDLFSEGKLVFKLGAPLILLWAADIGFGTVGLFFAGAISVLDQAAFGLIYTPSARGSVQECTALTFIAVH